MLQSSASAALVSCSLVLEPAPERMRLQRVVTNAPRRTVPSFALAELKTGDFSEVRLVEQAQTTAMRRFLNAPRFVDYHKESARNLVCRIIIGSGASRLQGVYHCLDCRLLVSERPCR